MSDDSSNLTNVLRRFDESSEPLDEHDIESALSLMRKQEVDAGLGYPSKSVAEAAAFMFLADYHWRGEGWASYYGPMFVGTTDTGKTVYTPDIHQFDAHAFAYWQSRARAAKHPILKLRYADLCWDFQKRIAGTSPPIDMPVIAIDSTVDAANRRLFKAVGRGIEALARAMTLALSIGDTGRVNIVRDSILRYEEVVAKDGGAWGFSFDLILEKHKVSVLPAAEAKIIADLETRLTQLTTAGNGKLDPWGAESAALRLARYYRLCKRQGDVVRVLITYGNSFIQMAEGASGMLGAAWLRKVHDHFREFGLASEAEAVLLAVRKAAQKSHDEMATHTQKMEVTKEEMEHFLESLIAEDLSMSLRRIAVEFVPDKDQIIDQIKRIRDAAPLSSLMSLTIVDRDGRPLSDIGSVEDDMNGRIAHHIAENMKYAHMFLFHAIDHIRSKFSVTCDDLLNHLMQSPAFTNDQRGILVAGLSAYLRDDHLAAAHLLVPQVEAAIRNAFDSCGGNLLKKHRGGGLLLKNLEELLREEIVVTSLTEDFVLYMRVLLTDQRGWNLRNNICHGLMPSNSYGRGMTDRLLHALLLVSLIRKRPSDPDASKGGGPPN